MEDIARIVPTLRRDDIIIAFMGPTGSGKSFFIDLLTGQTGKRTSNSLTSTTESVQATRIKHNIYGDRIVLVDTPGFDDTNRSDMQILTMISDWMNKTYQREVRLSGLIYLHRISDNRMPGSALKNLSMFGQLCGDIAMGQVILVSTMWSRVKEDIGNQREMELRAKFWDKMIEKGSMTQRLSPTTQESAWSIVNSLIKSKIKREEVLLQEEIMDLHKLLNERQAGKALHSDLQKALSEQIRVLGGLMTQMESSRNDPSLVKELRKEYERVNSEFQKVTFEEVKKSKISFGRRIMLLLFGKKTRAKSIKVT